MSVLSVPSTVRLRSGGDNCNSQHPQGFREVERMQALRPDPCVHTPLCLFSYVTSGRVCSFSLFPLLLRSGMILGLASQVYGEG